MNASNKEGTSDEVGVIERAEEGNNNKHGTDDKHNQIENTDERGT